MEFEQELIKQALKLGFDQIKWANIDLELAGIRFNEWLARDFHGEMEYMHAHGNKRWQPAALIEDTISVLSVRMLYHNPDLDSINNLEDETRAYISRYALGRDYHKLIRQNLQKLADWLEEYLNTKHSGSLNFKYRAFCDSAPVLERALAHKAGLGFVGKNTMIIDPKAGSYFFLGEIYLNINPDQLFDKSALTLIPDAAVKNHCGSCSACIDLCPTRAIVAPFQLDARLCISYLTIEYFGSIPVQLRPLFGNRIFGCDDCQLVCPWNRFAKPALINDFLPRHKLDQVSLLELFMWDEATFLKKTEGSPIRRIGHVRWLRNIAVALGNITHLDAATISALSSRLEHEHELVREHSLWALKEF